MPGRGYAAVALLSLGLGAGCYDGFDPLDPEVLAEIARTRGDAEGLELSGLYIGQLDPVECGCEDILAAAEISLCERLMQADVFGQPTDLPVAVTQADGTVQVLSIIQAETIGVAASINPTLYGPLDADGRLMAAGHRRAQTLVVDGQVLARLDGTLTVEGDALPVLEGEYQQRYRVDAIGEFDVADQEGSSTLDSFDCRERLSLSLTWSEPLPDPPPEEDEG